MSARRLDRSLIRDLGLFHSLGEADLDTVLATARVQRIAEGATVFEQGTVADAFYVLLHGRLKAVQSTPDGRQVVVRHLDPGDLFGIAMAMRRPDYPASAVAVVESLVIGWPASEWDGFVGRNPTVALDTLRTVAERLQDATTRIRELSTEEVERRIAHAVLRLVAQAGRKTDEGILIDFPITRQELADMTGSTLHTVSRTLSAWEAQGLVKNGRRKIVVCAPHRLRLVADGGERESD
ncbi:Crp/Fnr family transcriptional regulator [Siculibacillus lacustris]|uniref:Crp/Fnr family transcriptional regulator n=1 Tax=Siculibacillus lacustris TaxID=1549641 RepID=UPI001D18F2DD|nr:Crp/Fnr family transcriptional regulator [Siculibacillus lacustris]